MDFFERAGNFFTGGGWSTNKDRSKNDAERRRKEEEERRRREAEKARQAQQKQAKPQSALSATPTINTKPQVPQATQTTAPQQPQVAQKSQPRQSVTPNLDMLKTKMVESNKSPVKGVSKQEMDVINKLRSQGKNQQADALTKTIQDTSAAKKKSDYENSILGKTLNTGGQVARTIAGTAADMALRGGEFVDRLGQPIRGASSRVSNEETANKKISQDLRRLDRSYSDVREAADRFFFGGEKNSRGETQTQETDREMREISSGQAGLGTYFSAALKSVDLAGFLPAARAAKGIDAMSKLSKDASNKVASEVEKLMGRKLTVAEEAQIDKNFDDLVNTRTGAEDRLRGEPRGAGVADEVPTTKTTPTPEETKVVKSLEVVNKAINDNQSFTPQQKVELLAEARKRHTEMLKNLNESKAAGEVAQKQVVDEAAEAIDANAAKQAESVEALQQKQAEQVQPTPEQLQQEAPAAPGGEQEANNAYRSIDDFRSTRESIESAQKRNPLERFFTSAKRNLADPDSTTQKADNKRFKQMKKEGLITKGQNTLDPQDSLTVQSMMIQNPDQIVRSQLKRKRAGGESIADIAQKYYKGGQELVDDFSDYRIFKDELWRMSPEGGNSPNTLGIDPAEMAVFVRQFESTHPSAVSDNAVLRDFSLENFARRMEAGTESREMFEASARNPFYTPRERAAPEDAVRPSFTGGFNKAGKTTQGRSFAQAGVRSPLDLFEKDLRDTIVSEAVQRRTDILQDMGYKVSKSAEDMVARREIRNEMADIRNLIDKVKDGLSGVSASKKLNNAELNGLYRQGGEIMRRYLIDQSVDSVGVGMAKRMSIDELSDLFKYAVDADEISGKTLRRVMDKKEKLGEILSREVDDTRDLLRGMKQHNSELYGELTDITHNPTTGMAEVTYKVDGEPGKIEIPTALADEWSKNATMQNRSGTEKVIEGVLVNPAKVVWTGMLAPVFQMKQVFMNTGLAFRNADGLSGVSPSAIGEFLKASVFNKASREFKQNLIDRGAQFENATKSQAIKRSIMDDFARHSSFKNFMKGGVSSLGDVARTLNNALAHVSNAQRMAVARGAFSRAKRLGMNDETAMQMAAQAPAQVFGDFNRVSRLARNMEAVLPYSGAIQAGARSIAQASKRKPLETIVKDAVIVSSLAGIAMYNLANGNEEFYRDRIEQGKEYELDNNIIITMPGAKKNENGEWEGIWMIPLTPDMRPLNRAVWRSSIEDANENGGAMYAYELFNFFTGDMAQSVFDESRTDEGRNPQAGLFSGSPVLNAGRVLSNQNLYTGKQQVDEVMRARNREDQAWDSTSEIARQLSSLFGGVITPIQADQFLQQAGNFGKGLRAIDKEDASPLSEMFNPMKAAKPSKSVSQDKLDTRQYFQDMDDVYNAAAREGMDEKTLKEFRALHSRKSEEQKKSLLTTATKAHQFMQYTGDGTFNTTPLFELERRLDQVKRDRGEPGNPIYDLAPQELQAVLTYRSMKIPNAAKQNYTKDGEGSFTALGLDNKWYQDFQDAEAEFYNATIKDNKDGEAKTFSGGTKPQLTPEQQALSDQYYALPERSPERRAFRDANPWLVDFWDASNGFTDKERKALGFRPLEAKDSKSGGGGGGGGGYSPYGTLGQLFNAAALKRFNEVNEKPYVAETNDLEKQLRALFGRSGGGGANIQLGASGRGDTSRSDIG